MHTAEARRARPRLRACRLDASFKSGSSAQAFSEALERLLAHIAGHFSAEEALLAQQGYEHLEAHRLAHAGLLARAGELKMAATAGKTTLGDFVDFLANDVVAQHLFKADRDFFPLFGQQSAQGKTFPS